MTGRGFALVPAIVALSLTVASGVCEAGIAVDRLTSEVVARPGEIYRGTILVRNTADEMRRVRVYQTDYLFSCDGSNAYGPAGSCVRSNADWVAFGPAYLEVPPHGRSAVEYAVEIPSDQKLSGSYWSLVMIEELPTAGAESPSEAAPGTISAGVRQGLRYGVQLITQIGDTGDRGVRFVDRALIVRDDGTRVLHIDVENVGERSLRPRLWVELHDRAGGRLGRFEADRKRLYPGTSVRYMVDISDAPGGSYEALVVVDNGDEHVFGAQYALDL